jgi:N-acetylneuraminate synthase/N,N'-diacetyllegionaminate synthase
MHFLDIGPRRVGPGQPCFLVAEIGINHNGDLDLARRTVDAAVAAGADAVKFQNYRTEDFLADRRLAFEYVSQGRKVVEPQFDLFKRCELGRDALGELKRHCDRAGTVFHSTPTSVETLRELLDLDVALLKNGSDYLGHLPLIEAMGRTGLPTVLSTGMATLAEIDDAVRAFRATGNQRLLLLHCTSAYPTPPDQVHLRKIPALAAAFGCPVGFSDHSAGVVAALGAVSVGACFIEKHFTLDRNLPGPDHRFSSDPAEWAQLVRAVRDLELCLGDSRIGPAACESAGRREYRLSCVAGRALPAGSRLDWPDLAYRRPGTGLPPAQAHLLVGRILRRPLGPGDVIPLEACA